jgi:hypothetical protein
MMTLSTSIISLIVPLAIIFLFICLTAGILRWLFRINHIVYLLEDIRDEIKRSNENNQPNEEIE